MGNNNDYVWIRSDGRVFGLKNKKNCLICKHCTDIFWDYTHGPYMVICEESEKTCNSESNLPEETNLGTECNLFELEDVESFISFNEKNIDEYYLKDVLKESTDKFITNLLNE